MIRASVVLILLAISLQSPAIAPANEGEAVSIGGIKQWIRIKATNQKNPVLLFLHGGPGNSAMGYADKFTGELQKHFVVVLWDQRETGTTKKLNASPVPLTVERFEEDAVEMINYLRARFGKEKIYLMGHSWGGFLGMTVAAKHPELLTAYIAVSPMIYQAESERLSLAMMLDSARKTKNEREINELKAVRIPFENGVQLFYHRKWLSTMMGQRHAPVVYVVEWSKTWLALFNRASEINFLIEAPEIRCPIYFFVGRKDYQTHFKLIENYYNQVKADKKELFWFSNSAHLVITTEPGKMQEIIIKQILPIN